jgi:P27 family predicted phage terminase small subunit
MGRSKLSREAKIIRGTFRPGRETGETIPTKPLDRLPDAPEALHKAGAKLWHTLGEQLILASALTSLDLPAFTLLCKHYEAADELHEMITGSGPKKRTVKDALESDLQVNGALLRAERQEREAARKLLQDFGLTPAARNRVSLPAAKKMSPDDLRMWELLNGG